MAAMDASDSQSEPANDDAKSVVTSRSDMLPLCEYIVPEPGKVWCRLCKADCTHVFPHKGQGRGPDNLWPWIAHNFKIVEGVKQATPTGKRCAVCRSIYLALGCPSRFRCIHNMLYEFAQWFAHPACVTVSRPVSLHAIVRCMCLRVFLVLCEYLSFARPQTSDM